MSLLTHLLAAMAGGTVGVLAMALIVSGRDGRDE